MTQDPTSLDRLHDIVEPAPTPWWPPAPGWYVVIAAIVLISGWWSWRCWKRWRRNAYRRAALRDLPRLQDVPAIAELLRRTALAIAPRFEVASLRGDAWTAWLSQRCSVTMPARIRQQLTSGVYVPKATDSDVAELRCYAAQWISQHSRRHA